MDERPYAHVVSISGGKDSTALALVCREMIDAGMVPPGRIILAFAETDNEHQITYDYLAYLEGMLQMPIMRLRADFAQRIERKRAYVAEHWPEVASVFLAELFSGIAERLTGAASSSDWLVVWPPCHPKGERPSANPSEEVPLGVLGDFIRVDFGD